MPVTQYIGSRYVPLFADPIEWSSSNTYEPLTIVLHEGNSYTSKQAVPKGIDISNDAFWALTGNYNAQVELYRRETALAKATADDAQADADAAQQTADGAQTAAAAAQQTATDAQESADDNAQEATFYKMMPTWTPDNDLDALGGEGSFIDWDVSSTELNTRIYDVLMNANPYYITKRVLGRDASDLYDVVAYEFTPQDAEQTIIIQSGVHQNEHDAYLALARLAQMIVNNWDENPLLGYLRWKCQLIIVPVVNVWGVSTPSSWEKYLPGGALNPQYRNNYNGVALNGDITVNADGTVTCTQPETSLLCNYYMRFKNKVSCFFDLHSTVLSTYGYYYGGIYTRGINRDLYFNVIGALWAKNLTGPVDLSHYGAEGDPQHSFRHFAQFGLQCANATIEHSDILWSPTAHDLTNINRALEYFGNEIGYHAMARFDSIKESVNTSDNVRYFESGTDLDSIIVGGTYGVDDDAEAQALVNCPTTRAFRMFVLSLKSGNIVSNTYRHLMQVVIDRLGNEWHRTMSTNDGGETWNVTRAWNIQSADYAFNVKTVSGTTSASGSLKLQDAAAATYIEGAHLQGTADKICLVYNGSSGTYPSFYVKVLNSDLTPYANQAVTVRYFERKGQ